MNVSGLGFKTDKLKVRMAELKTLLQNSDYDIVLIQEAWYKREYNILSSAFPYASNYVSQGKLQEP